VNTTVTAAIIGAVATTFAAVFAAVFTAVAVYRSNKELVAVTLQATPEKQKERRIEAFVQLLMTSEIPLADSLTGYIENHLDDVLQELCLDYEMAFLEGPLGMGKTTVVKKFAFHRRTDNQGVYLMSFKKAGRGDAQELFYKGKLACLFAFSLCLSCSICPFLCSGAYGVLARVRGSPCPSAADHGQKSGADHR
jgi:rRNA pseudouridine-1189 N-methylase Emg1 (Nep1/Mra1 family)